MGIPAYFSNLIRKYPDIIKKLTPQSNQKVNHFYLDSNSIVYDAARNIKFEEITQNDTIAFAIILNVIHKIEEYIKLVGPDGTVMIALDGTPPIAKLEQQRQRRYKSWYTGEIIRSIKCKKVPDLFNTVEITCGTKFMSKLNERLATHFNDPDAFGIKNLIVSGSDECCEGEHKIFEYMRLHKEELCNDTHMIYGLDSDLIMLSINHLPVCPNIYLFRETPEFIKSIDSSLEPNEDYMLDIPELAKMITSDLNMGYSGAEQDVEACSMNRVYDYIFLCFFLGNDFLPHFPALNIRTGGTEKMINAYKATIGGTKELLTDGKTIYWKNVRKLIAFLAEKEHAYIKAELKLRAKREHTFYPDDVPDQMYRKFEAIPTTERELEKYIDPDTDYWEVRYYRSLFQIDATEENKKDFSINYLEGLEWTLKYYTTDCPDWRWKYKFKYPPLLSHMLPYIPEFETTFIVEKPRSPVSTMVQLAYVLPAENLDLLPKRLYKHLLLDFGHLYGADYDFVWCFCKYFWEAHVLLPEIDIPMLEKFVESNILFIQQERLAIKFA
jgi:5'-3' exoribonuclease 1